MKIRNLIQKEFKMALMRKFITAEEWHGLKDKWKDAVEELEQRTKQITKQK